MDTILHGFRSFFHTPTHVHAHEYFFFLKTFKKIAVAYLWF